LENYYEILGVSENATQDEIKKAFRTKSKELHPDRGGNEEEFKKINEAYSTIGDEQKRAEYDNQRNNPFANMGGNPFGDNPFDIFSSMFGGGMGQRRAPDRVVDIQIGAVDSFLGKQFKIDFTRKVNCDPCRGQGGDRQTCSSCGGTGRIMQRVGNAFFQNIVQTLCGSCGGNGFTFKSVCNICSGQGKVDENQSVTINIPVGMSDGQLIKAQSMGDYHEGMFGDIIFKVNIVEQDGFEKSAGDLIYTKFLSLDDFEQDELNIPHPHGDISIKMPQTIDTSKPLKVKGKGYQNERGDFYVKLHVLHTRKVAV
jgi:molecular chaperone DnaJ